MNSKILRLNRRQRGTDKMQIKFQADPDIYEPFVKEVRKHGLFLQDAYGSFMLWFTEASQSGELKVEEKVS